jgi:hypothetical protein
MGGQDRFFETIRGQLGSHTFGFVRIREANRPKQVGTRTFEIKNSMEVIKVSMFVSAQHSLFQHNTVTIFGDHSVIIW